MPALALRATLVPNPPAVRASPSDVPSLRPGARFELASPHQHAQLAVLLPDIARRSPCDERAAIAIKKTELKHQSLQESPRGGHPHAPPPGPSPSRIEILGRSRRER